MTTSRVAADQTSIFPRFLDLAYPNIERGDGVVVALGGSEPQLDDRVAGVARRLLEQLLLAAGEVVIDRATRRPGVLDHLREGGRLDTVLAHQDEGALDHAVARMVCHDGSRLILTIIIVISRVGL